MFVKLILSMDSFMHTDIHLTSDMQRAPFLTTDRVFRTVYKIVKSGRPFTDLPTDIDLQVLNGLDMGRT